MKDIDFDELDKAVNSLMTRAQKKDTSTPNDVSLQGAPSVNGAGVPETAAPISPGTIKPKSGIATNPDIQPAISPQPKTSLVESPSSSRVGAPATRRSGRFMDVVPSGPTKKPATPSRSISREGAMVSPRPGATISAPTPETLSPAQKKVESSTSPVPLPSVTEKTAPTSDWPDPLEFAKPVREVKESQPETLEEQASSNVASSETKPKEPLSSPFLPDAKVEKRPLGSPALDISVTAMSEEPKSSTPDDSAAQLPAQPSDVTSEPPEEFSGDVMKVEADTHMGMPKTEESHPAAGKSTSEKPPKKPETTPENLLQSKPEEEAPAEPTTTGRISIPQQYKEQPSTGEKESGAIYDTDTYHQPLSHPAKKKSGWLWVLWILLILVVGAGAGAALYFLGVM